METTDHANAPAALWSAFSAKVKQLWRTLLRERRRALILAAVLLCLLVLAVVLLRPSAVRPGALSVRVGDAAVEVPGTEILRRLGGSVTSEDVTAGQVDAAPHISYSDDMELLLDGTLFNEKTYVSVYTADREPLTLDQDHLVVPSEAGTYLVRVEAFWGQQSNLVASQYYFWLDIPAA